MHREVLRIYASASPTTKAYYELGRFIDGGNEDNWAIRWMLWNVFRYGMNRKRHPGSIPSSVASLFTRADEDTDSPERLDSPETPPAGAEAAPSPSARSGSSNSTRRQGMFSGSCSRTSVSLCARHDEREPMRADSCAAPYDPIRDP